MAENRADIIEQANALAVELTDDEPPKANGHAHDANFDTRQPSAPELTFPEIEDRPKWRVYDEPPTDLDGKTKRPGVYQHTIKTNNKGEVIGIVDLWLCAPLHVDARTADDVDNNHGLLLRFRTRSGQWRTWPMALELTAGTLEDIKKALLRMGLQLHSTNRRLLLNYLEHKLPKDAVLCTDRGGWTNTANAFVLGNRSVGPNAQNVVFQSHTPVADPFATNGTIDGWQTRVARPAEPNIILNIAICAAFAGPILEITHNTGAGIHLFGPSSIGKTTAYKCNCSVWGLSTEFGRTWRATSNGLEGIASILNDNVMALDEASECEPHEVDKIVYMLANGTGKARANRIGDARPSKRWRVFILSTGEDSIRAILANGKRRAKAGQAVRLLDIPAARTHGIFDTTFGFGGGRQFADHIKDACNQHYGTAGVHFLEHLTKTPRTTVQARFAAIQNDARFQDSDLQAGRAGGVFALLATAGELASEFGVTGWSKGSATKAAASAFQLWLANRGTGQHETREIVDLLREAVERFGDSRFSKASEYQAPNAPASSVAVPVRDRLGWWIDEPSTGRRIWCFHKTGLQSATNNADHKKVIDALKSAGALRVSRRGRDSCSTRLGDGSKPELFQIYHDVICR